MRASGHVWGPKGRNNGGAPTCQAGGSGRLLCGRRCVSTATSAANYLRLLFQVGFVNAAFDRGDRFRCGRFCHLGIVRKSVHAPTRAARYDKRPLLDELAEIDARSRRAESNPLCNLCPSHRRCGCRETVDDGSLCHRRFCIASRLVFASRFRVLLRVRVKRWNWLTPPAQQQHIRPATRGGGTRRWSRRCIGDTPPSRRRHRTPL